MSALAPLPDAALPAWSAYEAMLRTKDAHFSFLAQLEEKYRDSGRRTLAEARRLEQLLAEHDLQVRAFRGAVTALQKSDLAAHQALVEHIRLSNVGLGDTPRH